ncbi:MAG: hypothetical protein MRY49_00300 [Candidatus Pacebacteria bacterium]|nr:hypothetical protein [Candidatus Paceibacterota bacterium]
MASVTTKERLEYALGKKMVDISGMEPAELDKLLRGALDEVELREIRGLKPICEEITLQDAYLMHVPDLRNLSVAEDPTLTTCDNSININTQVMKISRLFGSSETLYKRHESDEETTEWSVASNWGKSAYLASGYISGVYLMRPRSHGRASDNLLFIGYRYRKVPNENQHMVYEIEVDKKPFKELRAEFGENYPKFVADAINCLRMQISITCDRLESQLSTMRMKHKKIDRLSDAIMA